MKMSLRSILKTALAVTALVVTTGCLTTAGEEKRVMEAAPAAGSAASAGIHFDDLIAGTQIDMASPSWSVQKVDGSSMIANVSSTMANSAPNSLYLLDNSSSDKPYALAHFANDAPAAEGTVTFDAYIPGSNEKTVYVNFGVGKNNSDRYFELRLSGSGKVQYEAGSDDPKIATTTTDEWHTYTVSWTNGTFSVSIDGVATDAQNISVESTGLGVENIPTTVTFYAGDKSSTGTQVYFDNIVSDLF